MMISPHIKNSKSKIPIFIVANLTIQIPLSCNHLIMVTTNSASLTNASVIINPYSNAARQLRTEQLRLIYGDVESSIRSAEPKVGLRRSNVDYSRIVTVIVFY